MVVQMDNSRNLNMEKILADVKSQYEEISAYSRKEAEAWYKNKVRIPSVFLHSLTWFHLKLTSAAQRV